ncbi:UNKNOWN [Stylonychia lemnae]|uniref:Uncharacterized protein n=1 Tax=Stylonychia lemnae TaxID=5949 RepID=A0A078BC12_STYLE|nr:UNKNOWN [Stylonychia lemnae]|eukprot:CDW90792.1 UNKNOWN [Stylonychia lemnae]
MCMLNLHQNNLPKIMNKIEQISPSLGLRTEDVQQLKQHFEIFSIESEQNKNVSANFDQNMSDQADNGKGYGGYNEEDYKMMCTRDDDEIVFDELGNLYLLDDLILQLLVNFKKTCLQ